MKKKLLVSFVAVLVMSLCLAVFSSAEAVLTLDKTSYTVGDSVKITFSNVTGDVNAWIAISPAGVIYEAPGNANKVWCYVNSGTETAGSAAVTQGTVTLKTVTELVSLPAGEYKVTYFPDISYVVGTEKAFTISAASNPATLDTFSITFVAIVCMAVCVILKRKSIME